MVMAVFVPSYAQKMFLMGPDKHNQKVIKRYNRYHHKGYYSLSLSRPIGYTAVFGVKKNSIMSTDDVEVNVVKKWVQDVAINDMENRLYFIEIENKSDQTLYIDKSRCFRVYHNGTKYCYFDPKRDDTISTKRIIAIPPHAKRYLSDYQAVLIDKGKYSELKIVDYPEDFNWDAKTAGVYEGFLNSYEVRSFSEDASPYYRTFVITYSKEADFSTYSLLTMYFSCANSSDAIIPSFIETITSSII